MKRKKSNVKNVLYIILLVILTIAFVASIAFGSIAAFATSIKEEIEVWYASTFNKDIALFKTSIILLIVSSILLIITLSFKDFKKKFID